MDFTPLVSIIIPVYNGSNYLKQAINSALNQDYKNIEVLVINDGSTDQGATEKIAMAFQGKIRYISKANGGVSTALNAGIAAMKGDYFSWLSHDDLYRHDKISKQINLLSGLDAREMHIAYSDYDIKFEEKGVSIPVSLKNTGTESFRSKVAVGNDLNGCTMLIPKSAFDMVGFFNDELRCVQDYDMWFRLSSTYLFTHIPESLVIGRVHGEQTGVAVSFRARQENIEFRIKCINSLTLSDLGEISKKGAPYAYLKIAETLSSRNLHPAAMHAINLSIKSASRDDVAKKADLLIRIVPVVVFGLSIQIYRLFRKSLSLAVPRKIKQILQK